MKIAVVGLGKMGSQIARKLAEAGHEVGGLDPTPQAAEALSMYGVAALADRQTAVTWFDGERAAIWLMIPADLVDSELTAWQALLPSGAVLIDGGNSDFRLTRERGDRVAAQGLELVDVGTSGGVWGYQNGFSMMVGGSSEAVAYIEPLLQALAAPEGGYHHFGPSGSGHYVKMVHNAIEYGMMESLAEGYRMLREGPYEGLDLAAAGSVWQQHSVITSWLNDLTQQALAENPELSGVDGFVAESGEARWTLEVAREQGIVLPAIQSAFDVRLASQTGQTNFATKLLAAMRNKFGGHTLNKQ